MKKENKYYPVEKYCVKKAYMLVILFFLFPMPIHAAVVNTSTTNALNRGLVGHWTFDGKDMIGGVARDVSGSGNNGSLVNIATSTFYTSGKIGQGFKFDGVNDSVTGSFSRLTNGTISLWVKQTKRANELGTCYQGLVSSALGASSPMLYLCSGVISYTFSSGNAVKASTLNLNQWYHIVVNIQSETATIYVDGVNQATSNQESWGVASCFRIGAQCNSSGSSVASFFNGLIDDVRIYNRALSATEVRQLYDMGSATKQASSPKVIATSTCSTGLSCGLVGYWTFDGKDMVNGVVKDVSGNGNNGSLVNIATSTFYTSGKIGQGFKFDGGNDVINMGNVHNFTDKMSVSLWFKKKNVDFTGTAGTLLTKAYVSSSQLFEQYGIYLLGSNDLTYFFVSDGTTRESVSSNLAISDTKWHHLSVTYDIASSPKSMKMYIDGVLRGSVTPVNTSINVRTDKFSIGGEAQSPRYFFPGSMDDVRVYNRALSATEVKQLYDIGSATKQATSPKVIATSTCSTGLSCGLVEYWTFDGKDMVNGVARDISGNGNHGNLVNIATSTFYTSGKIGQAGRFDGVNDYVVKSSASGPIKAEGTYSMWINPETISGTHTFFSIGQSAGSSGNYTILEHQGSSAVAKIYTSSYQSTTAPFALSAKKWTHIVFVNSISSSRNQVYINGILSATGDTYQDSSSNHSYIELGRNSFPAAYYAGLIDDVRIYNRALSATEVKQLYNLGR